MSISFMIDGVEGDIENDVNFSNTNALYILGLMGYMGAPYEGEWSPDELPFVYRKLMLAVKIFTDESMVRRFKRLIGLIDEAVAMGRGIYWG